MAEARAWCGRTVGSSASRICFGQLHMEAREREECILPPAAEILEHGQEVQ